MLQSAQKRIIIFQDYSFQFYIVFVTSVLLFANTLKDLFSKCRIRCIYDDKLDIDEIKSVRHAYSLVSKSYYKVCGCAIAPPNTCL